jgi:hypothetical protein
VTYTDHRHPDAEARAEREAEKRAQARAEGEPVTDRDWDQLEAGLLWNSYPGMGAA